MNTKVLLTVKTDKKLKEAAQKVAKEMGVPLGTIINAQLRDLVWDKRYTFSVPLEPNAKTKKILLQATGDIAVRKNLAGPFTSAKDAIAFLDTL